MPERYPQLDVFVGINGTGKSSAIKRIATERLSMGDRALVITPHHHEWPTAEKVHPNFPDHIKFYKGIRRMVWDEWETTKEERKAGRLNAIEYALEHFSHGLLILDDCRWYVEAFTGSVLKKLFISRRQGSFDILAAAHGVTEVPPKFLTYMNAITFFKSNDPVELRKKYFMRYEEIKALQELVEERVSDTQKAWVTPGNISNNKHYCQTFICAQ